MAKKLELGAEPWKMAALAVLLALAGYLFYVNVFAEPEVPQRSTTRPEPKAAAKGAAALDQALNSMAASAPETSARRSVSARGGRSEFKPSLKPDAEGVDLSKADPTLRLDLLEKLAAVRVSKVDRSLFEFAAGPPKPAEAPKQPEPKIVPQVARMIGPEPEPPKPPPPVKPPPPPITLKFYGSSVPVRGETRRVFLMDGDQVATPAEGEVFKSKYKIVKINTSSVVVEDLEHKNQQTLPIEEVPKTG